jgi:hypothetical protein
MVSTRIMALLMQRRAAALRRDLALNSSADQGARDAILAGPGAASA